MRKVVAAELQRGDTSLPHIAKRLGVSARTLRRRLQEENTSHQQLLDEMRHHLALQYLDAEGRAVGEVAFLLGFADTSAFSKAFKRWSGASPREARARHRASGGPG